MTTDEPMNVIDRMSRNPYTLSDRLARAMAANTYRPSRLMVTTNVCADHPGHASDLLTRAESIFNELVRSGSVQRNPEMVAEFVRWLNDYDGLARGR